MSNIIDDKYCGCNNDSGILYGSKTFSVVGGKDIEVTDTVEGFHTKYIVDYEDDIDPYLIEIYNQAIAEVGENIAALTVDVRLMPGSDDLIVVNSVPDIDPVPVNEVFSLAYSDVTSNTAGKKNLLQLNITDSDGELHTLIVGPTFKHRFFQGFSILKLPNEAEIESYTSYLGFDLHEEYGGDNDYVIPAIGLKQYIHWFYPVGTNGLEGALLSDLAFALVREPNVFITNAFGLNLEYVHYRSSANFVPQTLKIGLY
jgi:hypothetical protein